MSKTIEIPVTDSYTVDLKDEWIDVYKNGTALRRIHASDPSVTCKPTVGLPTPVEVEVNRLSHKYCDSLPVKVDTETHIVSHGDAYRVSALHAESLNVTFRIDCPKAIADVKRASRRQGKIRLRLDTA